MKLALASLLVAVLLAGCSPKAIYCALIVRQEGTKECE
jgi:hypothetical protein